MQHWWVRLDRARWVLLPLVALGAGLLELPDSGLTWHFVESGALVLAGPAPLDLYAVHPEVQMGPLAVLAALPFVLLGPGGEALAMLAMTGVGLLAVRQVELVSAPRRPPRPPLRLLTGALVVVAWADVAVRYGHVDDALALLLLVVALRAVLAGRPIAAATAVALATDCKPWAIAAAGVLLVAPRRAWAPMVGVLVLLVAAVWLPFALADPASVAALRFRVHVSPAATIHLLHLAGDLIPAWVRPLQLAGGLVLSGACARRGRPAAALLLTIAWRMLLDPATHGYYAAGLVVAAAALDGLRGRALPVTTSAAFVLVDVPTLITPSDAVQPFSTIRSLGLVALLLAGAALAPRAGPVSGRRAPRATPPASRRAARP